MRLGARDLGALAFSTRVARQASGRGFVPHEATIADGEALFIEAEFFRISFLFGNDTVTLQILSLDSDVSSLSFWSAGDDVFNGLRLTVTDPEFPGLASVGLTETVGVVGISDPASRPVAALDGPNVLVLDLQDLGFATQFFLTGTDPIPGSATFTVTFAGGETAAPIPLPAGLPLLLAGLGGLELMARRAGRTRAGMACTDAP